MDLIYNLLENESVLLIIYPFIIVVFLCCLKYKKFPFIPKKIKVI